MQSESMVKGLAISMCGEGKYYEQTSMPESFPKCVWSMSNKKLSSC